LEGERREGSPRRTWCVVLARSRTHSVGRPQTLSWGQQRSLAGQVAAANLALEGSGGRCTSKARALDIDAAGAGGYWTKGQAARAYGVKRAARPSGKAAR
jgi:hypothetical protein